MKTLSKLNLYSQIPFEDQSQKSPKSSNSCSSKLECRYCLCEESKEKLIQPCNCEGSLKYVHNSCLGEWIKNSQKPYEIIYENETAYYTSLCEICKYKMKYQINFENNFFVSFIYTMKNTLFSIKSCFFLLLHSLVIFYFFNRLTFLVYHGIYVVSKNFKTKYLMRFVNEMAIFSTILWYTNDIVRYYGNLFFEQRKSLLVFLPKEKHEKGLLPQKPSEFSFEMTVEKINANAVVVNSFNNCNDFSENNFNFNNLNNCNNNVLNESPSFIARNKTVESNFNEDNFEAGLLSPKKIEADLAGNKCNDNIDNKNYVNGLENNNNLVYDDNKNNNQNTNSNSNTFVNNNFSVSCVNNVNQADTQENKNDGFFYEIEFN